MTAIIQCQGQAAALLVGPSLTSHARLRGRPGWASAPGADPQHRAPHLTASTVAVACTSLETEELYAKTGCTRPSPVGHKTPGSGAPSVWMDAKYRPQPHIEHVKFGLPNSRWSRQPNLNLVPPSAVVHPPVFDLRD
jgi:hypothetical protein